MKINNKEDYDNAQEYIHELEIDMLKNKQYFDKITCILTRICYVKEFDSFAADDLLEMFYSYLPLKDVRFYTSLNERNKQLKIIKEYDEDRALYLELKK